MEYCQESVNINAWYDCGQFSSNIKINNGKRIENKENIKIVSSNSNTQYLLNRANIFLSNLKLEQWQNFLNIIENFSFKNHIKISLFLNIHIEKVIFDGVKEDDREYGYLRILITDTLNNECFKEIPVYITDDFTLLKDKIKKVINSMVIYAVSKNDYIEQKYLNNKAVIFSQISTGYFIHEVLGHLLEEDVYQFSSNILNKIYLPKQMKVVDDITGYETLVGLNKYDDTGQRIHPNILIEDSAIKNTISIENNTYGMARRENYHKKIMPRMRCTIVSGGDNTNQSEMINSVQEVILVTNVYAGFCSFLDGRFSIKGKGVIFRNNEIVNIINNLEIEGDIGEYLRKIVCMGNDLKVYATECCKLGEIVRVGIGGPSISFDSVDLKGDMYVYDRKNNRYM
jgi:hypothetical protein